MLDETSFLPSEFSWHAMPEWVRQRNAESRRASVLEARRRSTLNTSANDDDGNNNDKNDKDSNGGVYRFPAVLHRGASDSDIAVGNINKPGTQESARAFSKADAIGREIYDRRQSVAVVKGDKTGYSAVDLGRRKSLGYATHTVRFHGSQWASLLDADRSAVEEAFIDDVVVCTLVAKERIENLMLEPGNILIVKFCVLHDKDDEEMYRVHDQLQTYSFPKTIAVYLRNTLKKKDSNEIVSAAK